MALTERELRILRDIEGSLADCERRWAAIERRMRGRAGRWWLLGLCLSAPVIGAGLIVLGALAAHGGFLLAVLGSSLLAVSCGLLAIAGSTLWTNAGRAERPRSRAASPKTQKP